MISALAMTAEAQRRANHLWSAGITYQGAHSVLVVESIVGEGLLVVVPVAALLDVGGRELPVVVGQVDAPEEADALLLLREVQEQLDDGEAVVGEVALPVVDVAVALLPDVAPARLPGQLLVLEDLGVHAHHEDLLVVGAVEDADLAAARQVGGEAPQVVVVELQGEGALYECTETPCGFTPLMTWRMVPSLPAASSAWSTTTTPCVSCAASRSWYSLSSSTPCARSSVPSSLSRNPAL